MSAILNRKVAREVLADVLRTKVVSAQEIYAYQVANLAGKSPVVYITSSGSRREKLTSRGIASRFIFNIHAFVLYPSKHTGEGYTEQDAENILDDLESEIALTVQETRQGIILKDIGYVDRSNADNPVEIGGETYLHEIIQVEATCF